MNRKSLYFLAEKKVEIRTEELPALISREILVRSEISAISAGTELLIYRGEAPRDMDADESISSLGGTLAFPLKYGYALVGVIEDVGPDVSDFQIGQRVFSFNPHESAFIASREALIPIPYDIPMEDACFLPNMETAVNFIMDGQPMLGERVAVLGQGVVGILTTAILKEYPLEFLSTFEKILIRQQTVKNLGVENVYDPTDKDAIGQAIADAGNENYFGFDLVFELTGHPEAIDTAIALAGFNGRVVIGSWYGTKQAPLQLGGRFHRSRINLIASQVSTLTPELSGRWNKERRFQTAWEMIRKIRPSQFITHRFAIDEASIAYNLLDYHPQDAIQVVFNYSQK